MGMTQGVRNNEGLNETNYSRVDQVDFVEDSN